MIRGPAVQLIVKASMALMSVLLESWEHAAMPPSLAAAGRLVLWMHDLVIALCLALLLVAHLKLVSYRGISLAINRYRAAALCAGPI